MKIKFFGLFALIFVNLFAAGAFAAQPFDASPYEMQGSFVLHQTLSGPIERGMGDYTIKLIGEQQPGTDFNERLFLEITPPKGKGDTKLVPMQDYINGIDPRIELRNFRNNDVSDIFLAVKGEASTFKNRFYILELGEYEDRFIYDSKALNVPIVKGNFRAGYKLRVLVLDTSQESFVDLAPRRAYYNQRGYYNASNGALRREVTTWGDQFMSLEAVDVDGDNIYELRGRMVMYGTGRSDPLVQVLSVLKYSQGGWYVMRSDTTPANGLDFVKKPAPGTQPANTKGRIVKIKRPTPAAKKPSASPTDASGAINTAPAP